MEADIVLKYVLIYTQYKLIVMNIERVIQSAYLQNLQ